MKELKLILKILLLCSLVSLNIRITINKTVMSEKGDNLA